MNFILEKTAFESIIFQYSVLHVFKLRFTIVKDMNRQSIFNTLTHTSPIKHMRQLKKYIMIIGFRDVRFKNSCFEVSSRILHISERINKFVCAHVCVRVRVFALTYHSNRMTRDHYYDPN